MSPQQTLSPDLSHASVRDDGRDDWHPAALGDRQLLDLQRRLVKVQSLGDAFADVGLSPQMADRLRDVKK
jgi:hypothetical protein